jgi:nucleotide-binding universal stress UspA family protein
MRIVLAHQSWPSAAVADLAGGHSWPNGSTFKVVTSIEPGAAYLPMFPGFAEALAVAEHVRAEAEADQFEVLDALATRGWSVSGEIAYGRAASNLIAQARGFKADLLIVDGHPDGAGMAADRSIALDLLDTAPCPVLVVRRSVRTGGPPPGPPLAVRKLGWLRDWLANRRRVGDSRVLETRALASRDRSVSAAEPSSPASGEGG